MDHLRKVQSGQKLEIPAATFNSFVDAARDFQQRQRDKRSKPEPYFPDSGIILVANNSGADRNRFDVLGVTGPIISPDANLIEFKRRPTFRGVKPTEAHKCRFVVLLEPVGANKIARAVIAGVTVVRIRIDDPLDMCCDVEPKECGYLQTCLDGSAQILWKEKNSGVCWAIVRLGNCCEMDESSSSSSWSESSSLSESSSSSESPSESSSSSPSESSSSPSESSSSESSVSESQSEEESSSDQSSSESESPSESESCCGCRGVTATVRVLVPTPYRSGDNLCFPMADLKFVDGCFQGMSPAGVSCHYICCDEGSDSSSSDESLSDESSSPSGSSSPDDSASASESESPSGGESSSGDSSGESSGSDSSSLGESSSEDSSSSSPSESLSESSVLDDSSSSFRSDDASSDDSWSDSDPPSGNGSSSSDGSGLDDSSSSWSGW